MRRIDLVCKLVGPLSIALVNGASTSIAIFVTLGLNVLSMPLEYVTITHVWQVEPLKTPLLIGLQVYSAVPPLSHPRETTTPSRHDNQSSPLCTPLVPHWLHQIYLILHFYTYHQVFLPSLALSITYLTVLSLSGQMVTYLLNAGYTSFHIALVRTLSVIFELSATWIAPMLMRRVLPVRVGMWFLSWQMIWLGGAVSFFWTEGTSIVAASGLVGGTILSRVGLWGFDLCVQFIIQEVSL